MKNSLFFCLGCLLLVRCSLEKDVALPTTPVFEIDALFGDTTRVQLAGGVNGYYMFTDYDDSSSMLRLEGSLRQVACYAGDCPNSVTFHFFPDTSRQLATGDWFFGTQSSFPSGVSERMVQLSYVDAAGQVWSTSVVGQTTFSFFEVTEVMDFQPNENKQNTQQLVVSWQCQLFRADPFEARSFSGSGVIGVAVP